MDPVLIVLSHRGVLPSGHPALLRARGVVVVTSALGRARKPRLRAPVVDMVFGPQTYHRLPELIDRVRAGERPAATDGPAPARTKVVETEFPLDDKFDHLAAPTETAVRSRGVRVTDRSRLWRAVGRRLLRQPWLFLVPPRSGG